MVVISHILYSMKAMQEEKLVHGKFPFACAQTLARTYLKRQLTRPAEGNLSFEIIQFLGYL